MKGLAEVNSGTKKGNQLPRAPIYTRTCMHAYTHTHTHTGAHTQIPFWSSHRRKTHHWLPASRTHLSHTVPEIF